LAVRRPPWAHWENAQVIFHIGSGRGPPKLPSGLPVEAVSLLTACWEMYGASTVPAGDPGDAPAYLAPCDVCRGDTVTRNGGRRPTCCCACPSFATSMPSLLRVKFCTAALRVTVVYRRLCKVYHAYSASAASAAGATGADADADADADVDAGGAARSASYACFVIRCSSSCAALCLPSDRLGCRIAT